MLTFIKYLLIGIAICVALVIFCIILNILLMFIKGNRLKKRTKKSEFKHRNILLRIFWDFPRAYARDFFQKNPDAMKIDGVYIFSGPQGCGKTAAAVHMLREQLKKYPLIRVRSNIDISFQHGVIKHWIEVCDIHNGEIGQIDFIDELQVWFSNAVSKNFPPEMLQEITHERKKHKCVIGTTQVFTRLAKPIREQTSYLCLPNTFFGCFTVVRVYVPELDDTGTLKSKKFVRMYCFVHDDDLRASYDTFERVFS